MKKALIIIGIIILLAIISGGAFLWMQKPKTPIINDQTADWKTYKNAEYGFEFKYPDGALDGKLLYPVNGQTDCKIGSNPGENFLSLPIISDGNDNSGPINMRIICKSYNSLFPESKLTSIKVGNSSGYESFYSIHTTDAVDITDFVPMQDRVLEIHFPVEYDYMPIARKILSTFKFTK